VRLVERIDGETEAWAEDTSTTKARGGMVTKLQAAKLATASGVAVVIAHGNEPDVLVRLACGEQIGTLFPPTSSKVESRKRWMLSGLSSRGRLVVDAGAAKALTEQNKSLLPAGIREAYGDFDRGDIVDIITESGERIACGITNYKAEDVAAVKGQRSSRIGELLGYQYGSEVVHRNNLVLL